ncbi:hypothetical protein GDO81_001784, partial [Engystomops pustulosus]
ASVSGPSVFPLVPCCNSVTSDKVSIGCLSTGYLPTPVEVQWNSGSITSGIRNSPAILGSQGTYLSTSLLTIPASEWTSDKKYVCTVNHKPSGVKVNKEIEACTSTSPSPSIEPKVSVMQASCGENGSVDLVCLISGYAPKDINVQWLLNGATTSIVPYNSTPYKEEDGTFGSRSKVSVPKDDWNAGDVYTCKVHHPASDTKTEDTIKKCATSETVIPKVTLVPPSPKDILITKQPKVICQVSQMESTDSLTIKWTRGDGKRPLAFMSDPEMDYLGKYSMRSTLKINLADWLSGMTFTCIVQNSDLPTPIEKTIKKIDEQSTDPSVYIFPPPPEELAISDFVSITCYVKGFKPKGLYVQWLKQNVVQEEEYYKNTEPMQQEGEDFYYMYSTLMIEKSDWNRGATFTCNAVHNKITSTDVKRSRGK